jgi:F-type H+-transporting ATPase subunit gamma
VNAPPADLLAAERRMAAVGAVAQVTRAVWALARAQLPAAEAAAAQAAVYLDWVDEVVARLAGAPRLDAEDAVLWVLVGPERAFCGPLARVLLAQLPAEGAVGLVGARLAERAAADPALMARVRFTLPAAATPDEVGPRAEALAGAVLDAVGGRAAVLLHPDGGAPRLRQGVLLAGKREPAADPPETLSPAAQVLGAAVIEAVEGRLAVGLAEALHAEVRARLVAAEAARRQSERSLEALRQHWQVLRQESITRELLELAAAARAGAGSTEGAPRGRVEP